jgi:hypothetical protein
MAKGIESYLAEEIADMVEPLRNIAVNKLNSQIQELVSRVAVRAASQISYERFGNELVIRLDVTKMNWGMGGEEEELEKA